MTMAIDPPEARQTIVLIHGLWLTALSWEHWARRYSDQGFHVIARSWPGMDGDIETLRSDTSGIDNLGLTEITDYYAGIITALDRPPIIMGHSYGGLITQLLLDRGLGSAGVAIDSSPIKGVLAVPASTLRSGFPVLKNPANRHRSVSLTHEEFHYAFTNTLTEAESLDAYQRYAVPGPGRVLFQGALANLSPRSPAAVDTHNDKRAPLLIIAGGVDHVIPPKISEANAKLQRKSEAITAYREFPGRSHFTLAQQGWEDVADFALQWALDPTEDVKPS
jgi:alpha-beta hydrolase superfamily lysophospholipase